MAKKKICSHGNSLFSFPHSLDLKMSVIFSSKHMKQGNEFKLTYYFICLLYHVYEVPLSMIKIECQKWLEEPSILGRSGTQYVAMVTKLLSSYCGAHLVESYCKELNITDTNCLRYFYSYVIKI